MADLWEKINDDIPHYMKRICEKYKLTCVKISEVRTAIVGSNFALIIGINRYDARLYYLHKEKREMKLYGVDSFFIDKFDDNDRIDLLEEEGANEIVRNYIIIYANGLYNKWGNVLMGQVDWLEKYKNSSTFSEKRLKPEEFDKIKQYFE